MSTLHWLPPPSPSPSAAIDRGCRPSLSITVDSHHQSPSPTVVTGQVLPSSPATGHRPSVAARLPSAVAVGMLVAAVGRHRTASHHHETIYRRRIASHRQGLHRYRRWCLRRHRHRRLLSPTTGPSTAIEVSTVIVVDVFAAANELKMQEIMDNIVKYWNRFYIKISKQIKF